MKAQHLVITILSVLFLPSAAAAQPTIKWTDKLNCNNTVSMVGAIKTDNSGNVYVLSMFRGTIVFPNGVITENVPTSPGRNGALLAKYDSQGIPLWGKELCASDGQASLDMDIDSSGNVYFAVCNNVYVGSSQFNTPVMLAKYDPSGNQLWSDTAVTSTFGVYSLAIKLDATQTNLLLAFDVTGRGQMDLGNGIIINLGTAQFPTVAIASYDASSGHATVGSILVTNATPVNGIAVTQDNTVYISYGTSFSRLDYLNSISWTKKPMENSGTNVSNISGIATDGKDCFVVGNFLGGSVQLDGLVAQTNYTSDFFVSKVAADGTTVFIKEGCSGASGNAIGERIVFDKNKAFYISGNTSNGSTVGNPSFAMSSPNEHFILRYDSAGNAISMLPFNTNLNTGPTIVTDRAALTVNDSLSIFAAGLYKSTAHFGSDSLINNFSNRDEFVFRADQCDLSQPVISPSGATSVCQGQTVTLTCSTALDYSWSNDQTTGAITVSATGIYAVTVSNAFGCSVSSVPVNVTVNPLPSTPIINVAGNVLGSSSATGNQWLLNGSPITGAINQLFTLGTITDTACYSVKVTDSVGCSATSDTVCPAKSVGMYDVAATKLDIYPNPSNGQCYISFDGANEEVQILITDLIGKNVYQESFVTDGNIRHGIKTNGLAAGVYVLTLRIGSESRNEKIVIN